MVPNKKPNLPRILYVKRENEGNGDNEYLNPAETEDELVAQDEEFIGIYELKEVHAVKLIISSRVVGKKPKKEET